MRINKYLLPVFVIVALLGSVLVAKATGQWFVSGKQMVDVENLQSGDDIRGWMTLRQVAEGLGIPQADLYKLLSLPEDIPSETALKDLEGIVEGFEVSLVREVVDAHLAGQAAAQPASPMPTETSTPAAAGSEATSDHTAKGEGAGTGPTPLPSGVLLTGADIKGRHTLREIADQAQVPLADLLAALKLPPDTDPSLSVKSLVDGGKVPETQDVRDAVTALQAR